MVRGISTSEIGGSAVLTEGEKRSLETFVGKPVDEIETPALIVDLDAMQRNMDKMMRFLSKNDKGLRPHAKTHKTPAIASMQMQRGAVGITCATIGEAEILADGGVFDILITNRVVSEGKILRAVALTRKTDLKIAVDSEENLIDISDHAHKSGVEIGIVLEVDIGHRRAGVRTVEEALELARLASRLPGVTYEGIMGYEGHCVFIESLEERKKVSSIAYDRLLEYKDELSNAGFSPKIVSSGGTGTYLLAGEQRGITDIQPGSYIFMDARYANVEGVEFEQSLTVLTSIVSHPEKDIYICDAGTKSMSQEFGLPLTLPSLNLEVTNMSEEFITLVSRPDPLREAEEYLGNLDELYGSAGFKLGLGSKVHLIPSHCCTTCNLHDVLYATRNGVVTNVWRVAGRGRFA